MSCRYLFGMYPRRPTHWLILYIRRLRSSCFVCRHAYISKRSAKHTTERLRRRLGHQQNFENRKGSKQLQIKLVSFYSPLGDIFDLESMSSREQNGASRV